MCGSYLRAKGRGCRVGVWGTGKEVAEGVGHRGLYRLKELKA